MGGGRGRFFDRRFAALGPFETFGLALFLAAALGGRAVAQGDAAASAVPAADSAVAPKAPAGPDGRPELPADSTRFPAGDNIPGGDEFTPEQDKPEKTPTDPKKPRPDFTNLRLYVTPGDRREPLRFVKPGHWTAGRIEVRANNYDFTGELSLYPSERDAQPLDVSGTPFYVAVERAAVLAKDQFKQLDLMFFTPRSLSKPWLLSRLHKSDGGADMRREADELQPLADYQNQFVVIARHPERYAYLRRMASLRLPGEPSTAADESYLYRIIGPRVGTRAPLPREPLLWTSMAYLLWDDMGPEICDREQQQSLLDWIHWGGHLIINGPQTLDAMRDCFLTGYLPASGGESRLLAAADLAELETCWQPPREKAGNALLAEAGAWPAVRLQLAPGGVFLPDTGELVAERRVGRGSIVCTAFSLTHPKLIKWRGFDGFLNACLLRRDARCFSEEVDGFPTITWPDERADDDPYTTPARLTQLRYFVRDAGIRVGNPAGPISQGQQDRYVERIGASPLELNDSGPAAWNDFGAVAERARRALREGAGISVPRPSFVLGVLAAYLVMLVPLNWIVFRLLKRVELAWAAAPVISLGFAGLVVWLAQLDIGFARSNTELAIIELQSNYPRAHLTRYTALYASLSTTYRLEFPEASAVALPFASSADYTLLSGESDQRATFQFSPTPTLSGLTVASNSTSMVHSEAFWELPGSLLWSATEEQSATLTNSTGLALEGVRVVRRALDVEGQTHYEMAWIGDLPRNAVVRPKLIPLEKAAKLTPDWSGERSADVSGVDLPLNLAKLIELAERNEELEPGEIRLVGWCADAPPAVVIEPLGARRRSVAMVVAHLAYRPGAAPRPDIWKSASTVERPGE